MLVKGAAQRFCLLLCSLLSMNNAYSAPLEHVQTKSAAPLFFTVSAPYLELRSGPARGYPIIFTLKNRQQLQILSRKTQWLKVSTVSGDVGWIQHQYAEALSFKQKPLSYTAIDQKAYQRKSFELGFYSGAATGGSNVNTPLMATTLAWQFSKQYALEFSYLQLLGNNEESFLMQLDIQHTVAPEWPVSPTFNVGLGEVKTTAKSTLANTQTFNSNTANFGIGFKYPIKHRFILRGDYQKLLILSNKNQLDSVLIWKLGISIFF